MCVTVGGCQVFEHSLTYSRHRAYSEMGSTMVVARHLAARGTTLPAEWRKIQPSL